MSDSNILSAEVESRYFSPLTKEKRLGKRHNKVKSPPTSEWLNVVGKADEIEEKSILNMVSFYSEELRSGDFSIKSIPTGPRHQLKLGGILSRKGRQGGLHLTEKGLRLLEEALKDLTDNNKTTGIELARAPQDPAQGGRLRCYEGGEI